METNFQIGDRVACDKFASMSHDFVGSIEKIYENSAVVEIIEHHKDDNVAVTDFHNRTVVSLKHMKKITAYKLLTIKQRCDIIISVMRV